MCIIVYTYIHIIISLYNYGIYIYRTSVAFSKRLLLLLSSVELCYYVILTSTCRGDQRFLRTRTHVVVVVVEASSGKMYRASDQDAG